MRLSLGHVRSRRGARKTAAGLARRGRFGIGAVERDCNISMH